MKKIFLFLCSMITICFGQIILIGETVKSSGFDIMVDNVKITNKIGLQNDRFLIAENDVNFVILNIVYKNTTNQPMRLESGKLVVIDKKDIIEFTRSRLYDPGANWGDPITINPRMGGEINIIYETPKDLDNMVFYYIPNTKIPNNSIMLGKMENNNNFIVTSAKKTQEEMKKFNIISEKTYAGITGTTVDDLRINVQSIKLSRNKAETVDYFLKDNNKNDPNVDLYIGTEFENYKKNNSVEYIEIGINFFNRAKTNKKFTAGSLLVDNGKNIFIIKMADMKKNELNGDGQVVKPERIKGSTLIYEIPKGLEKGATFYYIPNGAPQTALLLGKVK